MRRIPIPSPDLRAQAGGGMLTIVATLGVLLVLVQGTLFYKSKGSARFLGSEKAKVLAQQLAEAGVEENIADLGNRTVRVHPGMADTVTYAGKPFGGGTYTTRLAPVALGAASDTVDLVSTGAVGRGSQTVRARIKLRKVVDTTRTPRVTVTPETTYAYASRTVADTARDTTIQDPKTMPALNKTPAYAACKGGTKKCDVCHLPNEDVSKAVIVNISKASVDTHISHHGDYVSTDGTCDLYKPKVALTISYRMATDTTRTVVDHTLYDTVVVIDTMVKVQILSWR